MLSQADNSYEFKALLPEAFKILRQYLSMLKRGKVSVNSLAITKNLSKTPSEYTNLVPQAVAAQLLEKEGGKVHPGQGISYVLTSRGSGLQNQAVPVELADQFTRYDSEKYADLLVASVANLLDPLGLGKLSLAQVS